MKRDEVKAIFPDATDEQLKSIMDLYGAGVNPLKSQLIEAQKSHEAALAELEKGKLSAEEQLAKQLEQAKARETEYAMKSARLEAQQVLVGAGLDVSDFGDLLDAIVVADSKKSVANAEALVARIASASESAKKAAEAALINSTPKPQGAGGGSVSTKADFLKLGWAEQAKLVEENPGILDTLA